MGVSGNTPATSARHRSSRVSVALTGLRLTAPAKLNLSLAVTGRRADGYHELAGTFVLLELADDLIVHPGKGTLRIHADASWSVPLTPNENLAWRGLVAGLGS